jgi:hypothetical protein
MSEQFKYEEFRISVEQLVAKIKEIVHEGNVRRVTIKNDQGQVLMILPLTVGVVGAFLVPVWAAVGALAALAANLTIGVEKVNNETDVHPG